METVFFLFLSFPLAERRAKPQNRFVLYLMGLPPLRAKKEHTMDSFLFNPGRLNLESALSSYVYKFEVS